MDSCCAVDNNAAEVSPVLRWNYFDCSNASNALPHAEEKAAPTLRSPAICYQKNAGTNIASSTSEGDEEGHYRIHEAS